MKLIKLEDYHYVIISDDEIKVDDIVLETYVDGSKGLEHIQTLNDIHPLLHKKVTHSSIPIEGISLIDKYEVKKLLGEVDVEKKADDFADNTSACDYEDGINVGKYQGYIKGYNQALEDNKDRKYTEEDMRVAIRLATTSKYDHILEFYSEADILQSLQPPTSWDVEFVDGKLKLL